MTSADGKPSSIRTLAFAPVRKAWRSLPRGSRQEVFASLTQIGLPSASFADRSAVPLPVVVVGALGAPTGLGQAARLALHALREARIRCGAIDVTARLLQPSTESFHEAEATAGPGTMLVYVTPPNCGYVLRSIPAAIRRDKLLVAGWVCETCRLPPMWRRQARLFHQLTAPSRFAADSIGACVGRPVKVVGHPVLAEPLPQPRHRPKAPGATVGAVLDVGSSGDRKNVGALIAAIRAILDQSTDVRVRLKVRDLRSDGASDEAFAGLLRAAPDRIQLVRADDSRENTVDFLDGLDLLLSMSRAEGFALPYAEAIMRGVRVAAVRWGGPAEYLDDANSLALPFSLVPIVDRAGLYSARMGEWADIDASQAARLVLADLRAPRPRPAARPMPPLFSTRFFVRSLLSGEAPAPDRPQGPS